MYIIETTVPRNLMILNPRPRRWIPLAAAATREEAKEKLTELRNGARAAGLNYAYRARISGKDV